MVQIKASVIFAEACFSQCKTKFHNSVGFNNKKIHQHDALMSPNDQMFSLNDVMVVEVGKRKTSSARP